MWPVSSMNEKSCLSVLKGTLTIDCWTYIQFSPAGSHKQNTGHLNNKDPNKLCINVFSIWLPSHWSSSIMTDPASECISCSSWLMNAITAWSSTQQQLLYQLPLPCPQLSLWFSSPCLNIHALNNLFHKGWNESNRAVDMWNCLCFLQVHFFPFWAKRMVIWGGVWNCVGVIFVHCCEAYDSQSPSSTC